MTQSRRTLLHTLAACALALPALALAQAAAAPANTPAPAQPPAAAAAPVRVTLETSLGRIVLELDAEHAPRSVANFVQYVQSGFYDETVFHRVIPGFMIQGGGYAGGLQRKPTLAPIPNEGQNGLRNVRGSIAMARTSDPGSATSQFFINVADNAGLDYPQPDGNGYAVFGRVVEGMDVVDRIVAAPTRMRNLEFQNLPIEPVFLKKAHLN